MTTDNSATDIVAKLRRYANDLWVDGKCVLHESDLRKAADRIKTLKEENAKLRAIVDKLPKCWRLNDNGELVQDVPVSNGKVLWHTHSEDGIAGPHPTVVYGQTPDGYWLLSDGKTNFTLYSTYEAAEAARKNDDD